MSRSDRMFDIIQILRRARAPITAQAIARLLEVTKRTIYRDIAALQPHGFQSKARPGSATSCVPASTCPR